MNDSVKEVRNRAKEGAGNIRYDQIRLCGTVENFVKPRPVWQAGMP